MNIDDPVSVSAGSRDRSCVSLHSFLYDRVGERLSVPGGVHVLKTAAPSVLFTERDAFSGLQAVRIQRYRYVFRPDPVSVLLVVPFAVYGNIYPEDLILPPVTSMPGIAEISSGMERSTVWMIIFATPEYMISEMTVTNDRYDTIPVYYTYCSYILL